MNSTQAAIVLIILDHLCSHLARDTPHSLSLLLLLLATVQPRPGLLALASVHRLQTNFLVGLLSRSPPAYFLATLVANGVYNQNLQAIGQLVCFYAILLALKDHQSKDSRVKAKSEEARQLLERQPFPILLLGDELKINYINRYGANYIKRLGHGTISCLSQILREQDRLDLSAAIEQLKQGSEKSIRLVTGLGQQYQVVELVIQKASPGLEGFSCFVVCSLELEVYYHTIRKFQKQLDSLRDSLSKRKYPSSIGCIMVELQLLNVFANLHNLERERTPPDSGLFLHLQAEDSSEQEFNLKHLVYAVADSFALKHLGDYCSELQVTFTPDFCYKIRGNLDLYRRLIFCLFFCAFVEGDIETKVCFRASSRLSGEHVFYTFLFQCDRSLRQRPLQNLGLCLEGQTAEDVCCFVYHNIVAQLGGRLSFSDNGAAKVEVRSLYEPGQPCPNWFGFCGRQQYGQEGGARVSFRDTYPVWQESDSTDIQLSQSFEKNKAVFLEGVRRVVQRVLRQKQAYSNR